MSKVGDEYRGHADRCARVAAETLLPNVRERELRSEEKWLTMAQTADAVATGALEREAATRERRGY